MRMAAVTATLLTAVLSTAALATEPPSPSTGPTLLDERQLDQVSAGLAPLVGSVFWQVHNRLASGLVNLPEPAPTVILLLHTPILMPPP